VGLVTAYLLDTHAFLWAVQEDWKLGNGAREAIENIESKLFVSAVSAFEIANKYRLGKLPDYQYVTENCLDLIRKLGANELPISAQHAYFAAKFDWEHRDPFDRLLAAKASSENLVLITSDSVFDSLSWVATLW
jgi:PIN domain nuclease of toxin-antitoxin system